jgi:predicted nucleotidyltransferase
MSATAGTTTIEVPLPLRARLAKLRAHPRQPYHEVIRRAVEALEGRTGRSGLDALVGSHQDGLRKAARRNKISRIWLFGSRARGDARPDSDVDILYKAEPGASLFDISGFLADAQDLLGVVVEVADVDNLRAGFSERILPEAVLI